MLFSVIIPTFKRRESLRSCLQQLAPKAQTISADLYEVIVTDDGLAGTPDTLEKEFPWIRHLSGPQKGPASNRNNGAKAARGQWLIFLDDDCLPQPTFLPAYQEAVQLHPEHRVFEGSTLAERRQFRLDEEAPINESGGYLWSCNFMVQRDLFNEIGGFCELFPYACMEDVDFRERLNERKIGFLFVPRASVIHPWRSLGPEDKYLQMLLVSHAIFYTRYPNLKPSFFNSVRTVVRIWVLGLLIEAPRLGFRGFKRYYQRQSTLTQFHFRIGQQESSPDAADGHAHPVSSRPGDV